MKTIVSIICITCSSFVIGQDEYEISPLELKASKVKSRIQYDVSILGSIEDSTVAEVISYDRNGNEIYTDSSSLAENIRYNSNREIYTSSEFIIWEHLPDGTKRKLSSTSHWFDEFQDDSLTQNIEYKYTEFGKIEIISNSQTYLKSGDKFIAKAIYLYNEKKLLKEIIYVQYPNGKETIVAKNIFRYDYY